MKKMNNKGFSLVELIIVIAIMAILIVVLAPQYLKYVEKSRNSTDLQSITEFKDAIEVWAADPDAGTINDPTSGTLSTAFKKGAKFTLTCDADTNGGVGAISGAVNDGDKAVASALDQAGLSLDKVKCTSKTNWKKIVVIGTVQDNGSMKWEYTGSDPNFVTAMTGKAAAGGTP